jgi:hypothetical protein
LASTGKIKNWTVNGLSGNERLRRYLARAAAWPNMDYGETLTRFEALEFFPES